MICRYSLGELCFLCLSVSVLWFLFSVDSALAFILSFVFAVGAWGEFFSGIVSRWMNAMDESKPFCI